MNFLALGLAEEAIVTLTGGIYISYFLPGWVRDYDCRLVQMIVSLTSRESCLAML